MPVALVLGIQQVAGLIDLGLSTISKIRQAIRDGKTQVNALDGVTAISAEDLHAHYLAVKARAAGVGEAASQRLEAMPPVVPSEPPIAEPIPE